MNRHNIHPVNIGYGNFIMAGRVLSVVVHESSPIKRKVQSLKEEDRIIDATHGRKTRSVILLDDGSAILSSLQAETIVNRIENDNINHINLEGDNE